MIFFCVQHLWFSFDFIIIIKFHLLITFRRCIYRKQPKHWGLHFVLKLLKLLKSKLANYPKGIIIQVQTILFYKLRINEKHPTVDIFAQHLCTIKEQSFTQNNAVDSTQNADSMYTRHKMIFYFQFTNVRHFTTF